MGITKWRCVMSNNVKEIKNDAQIRQIQIFKTSIIGIIVNLLLVAFKAVIGALTNSIAIILDAVNNLSDALSSVITIIGTKLAAKPADKKHPLGYGRIEYLSSAIISVIIIYAGVTSLVSSVKKIITPEAADYSVVSLVIIGVAVVAKLLLGLYVRSTGKKVNSDSLVASGVDALFDSIISTSTIVAAVIYLVFGFSLEAWLGVIISGIIIKSGVELLLETLSKILGERADADLSKGIKETVCSVDGVQGVYDLVLNNYGPDSMFASLHIEVFDYLTADEIDRITRKIQDAVMKKHAIYVAAVGVYSINTRDEEIIKLREGVEKIAFANENVIQLHGFYYDKVNNIISLDCVVSFSKKSNAEIQREITDALKKEYPKITFVVAIDIDISD